MIKINAIIEEMNYRIAENKAAFREELAKLKVDQAVNLQYSPPQPISIVNRREYSIPTLPKNKQPSKHYDS